MSYRPWNPYHEHDQLSIRLNCFETEKQDENMTIKAKVFDVNKL